MHFTVVGAGAMGIVLGTTLARAGHDVGFLGRPPGEGELPRSPLVSLSAVNGTAAEVTLNLQDDPATVSSADVVLILVKTGDTIDAVSRIAPHLRCGTPVVTLQNGLGARDRIRAVLGEAARILPAVTAQAAMRTDSTHVFHTGEGQTFIGYERREDAPVAAHIAQTFSDAGLPATAVSDIDRHIWRKAAVNSAINGLTGLGGFPNGAILEDPGLLHAALTVAGECAAVALAHGVDVGDIRGAVVETAAATARNRSSMLQDIDAGRKTEVDAIHVAIYEAGRNVGVAAPATQLLAALIADKAKRTRAKEQVLG